MKELIREKAKEYAFENDGFGYDLNTCEDIFTEGAEWIYDMFEQNRLYACKSQTKEAEERERLFTMGFVRREHRIPTFSDVIELVRKDTIEKACEWLYQRQTVDLEVPNIEKFVNDFKNDMK